MPQPPSPLPPTLAGFTAFIQNVMEVPTAALPTDSPYINDAFCFALAQVNWQIERASSLLYNTAVYNLGGSLLINYCPDHEGQTYFAALRTQWNITAFVPGVVLSGADEGTSSTLVVPDFMKGFQMGDLQRLKDPYGREYLAIAQQAGPTIWELV